MWKLRAYNTYNASAVIETDSGMFFIESPYTDDQVRPINAEQLTYLVNRLEYFPADISKDSLNELVIFVQEKAESARPFYKTSALTEADMIAGFELYPEDVLHSLLDDLRERYFDAGKYEETKIALGRYWKVGAMFENEGLRQKLIALNIDVTQVFEPMAQLKAKTSMGALPLTYNRFGATTPIQVRQFDTMFAA